MGNGFEDLDAKLIELDAALADPDSIGGPVEFFSTVEKLTGEASKIACELTQEDFDSEYTLDEASDEETEGELE